MGDSRKPAVDRSRIVYYDLETTGLELGEIANGGRWCVPLELGMLCVDAETLEPIDGFSQEIRWTQDFENWENTSEFVREMHRKTGLWDRIRERGVLPDAAWKLAHAWLDELGYGSGAFVEESDQGGVYEDPLAYAAGAGLDRFDTPILGHYALGLKERFHYRPLDVSTIQHALEYSAGIRVGGKSYDDLVEHQALDDCVATNRDWAEVRGFLRTANVALEAATATEQLRRAMEALS